MVLADLARAAVIRALAGWLLAGALLAVAEAALRPVPPRASLVVEVAADAGPEAVRAAVDEAVLLAEARRLGWHRSDPVVSRALMAAMEVVDPAALPDDALDAALALGLDLTEPMARARLLDRARRALAEGVPEPTEAELAAWLAAHPDRYAVPERWRFEVHGGLRGGGPEVATRAQVAARYGAAVADALADASPGDRLLDPVPLTLHERLPAEVPPLSLVRAAVRRDVLEARSEEAAAARLEALRAAWPVTVVRR